MILGSLERWIWSNDRRHRTFYCKPRGRAPCAPPSSGGGGDGGGGGGGGYGGGGGGGGYGGGGGPEAAAGAVDCYEAESVRSCLELMLPRAVRHLTVTLTLILALTLTPAPALTLTQPGEARAPHVARLPRLTHRLTHRRGFVSAPGARPRRR